MSATIFVFPKVLENCVQFGELVLRTGLVPVWTRRSQCVLLHMPPQAKKTQRNTPAPTREHTHDQQ